MTMMPRTLRSISVAGFIATLLVAPVALADLAPIGPEPCTLDKVANGRDCVECKGAYHGDIDFCVREQEGQHRTLECKTRGASVWTEIWCGEAPADTSAGTTGEVSPSAKSGTGKSGCSAGMGMSGIAALVGAAGLLLQRRRRD